MKYIPTQGCINKPREPQRGDHNVLKQPIVHCLPSSRLPEINLVRKEISSNIIPRDSALSGIFEDATKRLKEMYKKKQ